MQPDGLWYPGCSRQKSHWAEEESIASLLAKAIRYEHPETIPVSVSALPAVWLKYGEKFQKIADRFPQFFGGFQYNPEQYGYASVPR